MRAILLLPCTGHCQPLNKVPCFHNMISNDLTFSIPPGPHGIQWWAACDPWAIVCPPLDCAQFVLFMRLNVVLLLLHVCLKFHHLDFCSIKDTSNWISVNMEKLCSSHVINFIVYALGSILNFDVRLVTLVLLRYHELDALQSPPGAWLVARFNFFDCFAVIKLLNRLVVL